MLHDMLHVLLCSTLILIVIGPVIADDLFDVSRRMELRAQRRQAHKLAKEHVR